MMLLESQLRKIITEETKRLLLEQELKTFILENLTQKQIKLLRETGEIPEELIEGVMDWLRKKGRKVVGTAALIGALMGPVAGAAQPSAPPTAATAQVADSALANTQRAVENVRKQLSEKFKSPQSAETFLKFSKESHSPTFAEQTDDQIKEYYNKVILPKLLDIVGNTPTYNTTENESTIPASVMQKFASDAQVGGLFDPETNAIYMNPESFERTNQTDLGTITTSVMEEFYHAIDGNIEAADLFPSLASSPQAETGFATSMTLKRNLMNDIIKPQAQGDYVAVPQEFHAKLQVIKTKLQNKHPDFFNARGEIDLEKLNNLLHMPKAYFDFGEIDFRIFDAMKKDAGEKIKQYLDQVVKADTTTTTSQFA